ncbi:MAG: hypothetical protein J2P36_39475, partial [Ktedonobacteraceae bacterium]|nr:hypothetical protein [Ktedonobacteraceae bacterium]
LLEGMLARYGAWLDLEQGQLAHGDFSNRHIYQSDGQYTGMIDFGDSKGTGGWHDLAYYHIRDGGRLPWRLESALLCGYGEVTSLPSIYEQYIRFTGVLLNVQLLVHGVQKLPLDRDTLHLLYVLRQDLRALR